MKLSPREKDKLLVSLAADVAKKRLNRGVKLNYPEVIAIISDYVLEGARDGKSVSDLMERQMGKGVDVDLIDPAFGILSEFDDAINKIELANLDNANELIDSAVDQFLTKLDEVAPSVRFANSGKAGKFIRNSLQQKLDLFRTKAGKNYGEALQAVEDYKRTYGDQIDFDFKNFLISLKI